MLNCRDITTFHPGTAFRGEEGGGARMRARTEEGDTLDADAKDALLVDGDTDIAVVIGDLSPFCRGDLRSF